MLSARIQQWHSAVSVFCVVHIVCQALFVNACYNCSRSMSMHSTARVRTSVCVVCMWTSMHNCALCCSSPMCVSVSVCGECHGVLCNIRFRGCFHSSVRPWGVVCSEACVACDGGIAQW